jgi:hypothetical protein
VTIAGAADAPSQLPVVAVPVPGQEWHELQSWLPGAAEKALWSSPGKLAAGLMFMWQLLHRAVVPFITNGFVDVKLAWNLACAHSFPCTPATVETPFCVWQKLQSWVETLASACVI